MAVDIDDTLKGKTLKELQALAKARGLKGYSKISKEQLVKRLAAPSSSSAATKALKTPRVRKTVPARAQAAAAAPPLSTATVRTSEPVPPPAAATAPPPAADRSALSPQWVERAKYALRPNGGETHESGADLDEDIDRLPTLSEPMVCLLPQKPGVLHAYWALPQAETSAGHDYKLRLCRGGTGAVDVCEEISARAPRGSWYFHVAEDADNAGMLVQLGHYHDGRFVLARGRSIARLPSVYASSRTDDRWWIGEEEFMRMYLRAGGFLAPARRYGWVASISSPGGVGSSSK